MLVDFERVLLDLKRYVATKSHHGQRELFAVISQFEVANRIDESLPERALRLYGLEFFAEAIRSPGSGQGRVPGVDGAKERALRADSQTSPEEDNDADRGRADEGGGSVTRFDRRRGGVAAH